MDILGKIVKRLRGTVDIVRAGLRGSERTGNIDVYGRPEFRRAVRTALLMLREANLPAWETLTRHVDSILEGGRTVAVVTASPAFIFIDRPHADQAPALLAATIAHLACSCQLHRDYQSAFPGRRVPRDTYSGSHAQERCEAAYRECLLALKYT